MMDGYAVVLDVIKNMQSKRFNFNHILKKCELEPDELRKALSELKSDGVITWINKAYEIVDEPNLTEQPAMTTEQPAMTIEKEQTDAVIAAIGEPKETIKDADLEAMRLCALASQETRPAVRDWLFTLADKLVPGVVK
jgi:glyoxylate utilization-related uncharacterized protein